MSLSPGRFNISAYQGATFANRFVWRGKGRRPINLTGYTARMQVRATEDSPVKAELTTENGGIELYGSTGVIEIKVTNEQIEAIGFEPCVYDLFMVAPDGTSVPILKGKFTVTKAVTKNAN